MSIKNKTIIVTGGSDGIGKQIVLRLAKLGPSLVIVALNEDKLRETAKEAESLGAAEVKAYSCDIRDAEKVTETVNQIASDFGGIDVLINNAGIWHKRGQLDEIEMKTINDVIQTNLTGLIYVTKVALPFLRKSDEAAIINISSRSGITAQPGQSVYSPSKWGVHGFTEVLKEDLKETKIKVAGVYQGGVHTNLFTKAGEEIPAERSEKFMDPADLADVVVFMLTRPDNIWLDFVKVSN
ncbi:MAG: SDR family oxidoreductase [Patescibacteria group bacterium]|nr:SDR family oxidoreductase [Patescibacteria group bacterium]